MILLIRQCAVFCMVQKPQVVTAWFLRMGLGRMPKHHYWWLSRNPFVTPDSPCCAAIFRFANPGHMGHRVRAMPSAIAQA